MALAFFLTFLFSQAPAAAEMLVIGDSGVTGAASSEDLDATWDSLSHQVWTALWNPPRPIPFVRVPFAAAEAPFPWQRWWLDFQSRFFHQIDVPENSFAAVVAADLGIAPRDVVFVGQDGVQVSTLPRQWERWADVHAETLPPLVLISFTANDFCDEKVLRGPLADVKREFQERLTKAWEESAPYLGKPHPSGTRIAVLAPFDVVGVMTQPGVQRQKVKVEGSGEITCGRLRSGDGAVVHGLKSFLVLRLLQRMCPAVTLTMTNDAERLDRLRAIEAAYVEVWKDQIISLQKKFSSIQWEFLDTVRDLEFSEGDVANDCFHPSKRGHQKTAALILSRLRRP